MKCAICGKEIENKFGNNPYPVRTDEDARCCDECNFKFVIPYRIALLGASPKQVKDLTDEIDSVPDYLLETHLERIKNM